MKKIQPRTKENILIILEVLQRYDQLHIRGLKRIIEAEYNRSLNPNTINRIIEEYLSEYINITNLTDSIGVRLKFCSLKQEYRGMSRPEIVSQVMKKALARHEVRKKIHE